MSDPADKSDDLIAELAKLMAASPGSNPPAAAPIGRPAALEPMGASPAAAAPTPIRIPGMNQPRPAPASPAPVAAAPARAPVTGAIRIPGMDNPAPVATSAPVSKFDFGAKPVVAAPIKQESLSTLAERLAPQNPTTRVETAVQAAPQTAPTPIRIPSDLKPVSENRSFAQGPTLTVSQTAPAPGAPVQVTAAPPKADYSFDFGLDRNPRPSVPPPAPANVAPQKDPIADLIASSMGGGSGSSSDDYAHPPSAKPVPVARGQMQQVQPAQKSTVVPAGSAPRPASTQPIPLKPVSVAPRAPEPDRFATSPGAGLAMKAPANQEPQRSSEPARSPFEHSDPMSEIESLIGEAVRVELAPPGPVKVQSVQQKVAPHVAIGSDFDLNEDGDLDEIVPARPAQPAPAAPVVPPLNSNFAPRRSGLKEDSGQTSAEDAILAAAAATGAKVDHIEPRVGDETPYRRLKVKPARSSFASGGVRQYVGMAVAGTLLLAAGLGLYWVLNMGRANNLTGANAPQLTADATPVKELPSAAPADETETARSPVLEQMAGTSTEPSTEQLVSTDETASTPVTRDVTDTAAGDDTEGGLANRKVRTVTVRPDGTIVSGDDAVAGTEALPVDRPNVPAVPTTETTNLLGDTTSVAMTDTVTENPALTGTALAPLTPEATPSTEPVALTAEAAIEPIANAGGVAPTPIAFPVRRETVTAFVPELDVADTPVIGELTGARTPNGQIDLLGGEIRQPVSVAAAEPVAVDAGSAAAYVQLSSSPSEADAQASLRSLNSKFGSLFGGNQLIVQSADLGQKGTWYRVKLPVASLTDAGSICADVKANGGDCIVSAR
jgi:hypothetical protein